MFLVVDQTEMSLKVTTAQSIDFSDYCSEEKNLISLEDFVG